MVVLKQFQKNLFHMLHSLARILWDTGVPLGGKCCINWVIGMLFITSNRKLHLFGNFCMFKRQNTEYNYTYVENNIYKKLKEAGEIHKNQTKNILAF